MTNPALRTDHPNAILPSDRKSDRSLFMVLAIFAFLATLAILAYKTGLDTSSKWGAPLSQSLTVQIKAGASTDLEAAAKQAQTILLAQDNIQSVTILPLDYSKDMLKPWLGSSDLPEGLPVPILLDIKLKSDAIPDLTALKSLLTDAGIRADIDDHGFWLKDLRKKIIAFKLVSLLWVRLILLSLVGAIIFATRAGINSWHTLMDVLEHIGATPKYTAKLFASRFFKLAFKAGLAGALFAVLIAVAIAALFTASLQQFGLDTLIIALCIPVLLSVIAASVAWRTIYRILYDRIYP